MTLAKPLNTTDPLIWQLVEILPVPSHILVVGENLLDLLQNLQAAGYCTVGIEPEYFPPAAGYFDGVLIIQSIPHFPPLDFFAQTAQLLCATGKLIVVDQFSQERHQSCKDPHPLLKHFTAIASRFGFEMEACPNMEAIPQTGKSNNAILCFSKSPLPPRWQPGAIRQANHEQMLALFRQCFGHDMSSTHWHWKYADGRGQAVGIWQNNTLVAHYGGTTRDILFFGEPQKGLFPCDVMVKQDSRTSLARKSPFFLVTATFLELYQGYGTQHILALGFPNERHNTVAQRLGFYYNDSVDEMVEVEWMAQACKRQLWTELRRLEPNSEYTKQTLQQLWQAMRLDFTDGVISIRDWDYLKHRYFEHPDNGYHACVVRHRLSKRPYGMVIYRQHSDELELLDIIAPLQAIPTIINHTRKLVGCLGLSRLYCWITDAYAQHFTTTGGIKRKLGIPIPTISWTAGLTQAQVHRRCWLTGGDTDFR